MLDQNIEDLNKWISDWIEITDKNNICPYAKPALKLNKIKTIKLDDIDNAYDFWIGVSTAAENFNDEYDVVILAMNTDPTIITEIQLLSGSDSLNANLNYRNKHVWALTLFSKVYTLVLLQSIVKLDDASNILEKKGQYKNYHPYRYNKDIILRRKLRNNLK